MGSRAGRYSIYVHGVYVMKKESKHGISDAPPLWRCIAHVSNSRQVIRNVRIEGRGGVFFAPRVLVVPT
jgi:hypothetical protein